MLELKVEARSANPKELDELVQSTITGLGYRIGTIKRSKDSVRLKASNITGADRMRWYFMSKKGKGDRVRAPMDLIIELSKCERGCTLSMVVLTSLWSKDKEKAMSLSPHKNILKKLQERYTLRTMYEHKF